MISVRPAFFRNVVVAIAVVGFARANAGAQDDPVVEEKLELARNDDRMRRLDQAQETWFATRRASLQAAYRAQFGEWVASQFRTLDRVLPQFEMLLAARVRQLTAQCRLTDEQARKLELAGRGDIKRYMDRIEYVARTIENPMSSIDDLRVAGGELRHLGSPARERLFGEDSLLAKTLVGTLDRDQAAAHRAALAQRNKERHAAAIAKSVTTMQDNLGLSERQRDQLKQLLSAETRPPRKFGDAPEVALVLFQASRIPEDKIRPIFDDDQWRVVRRWISVYVERSGGRETLNNHGFVFDDDPSARGADRERKVATQNGRQEDRPD